MTAAGGHTLLILGGAAAVAAALAAAGGGLAAAAGALLAGLGGAAGFLATVRARKKDQKAFMQAVFGGMILRLSSYGVALVAVHLATSWSIGWFAGGLLGAHLVGQVIEIRYLTRRKGRPAPPPGDGDRAPDREGEERR
jgi:hypothetical protein